MNIEKAIEAIAEKTGLDWYLILSALNDRGIFNADQRKQVEEYFFMREFKG